ncbi:MAG: hypothetical protein AAFV07_02650 [Bacteroidota bacterium]
MPTPLKDLYSPEFLQNLAVDIADAYPAFSQEAFVTSVFADNWVDLELKERMAHICQCLRTHIPLPYAEVLEVLKATAAKQKWGFEYVFFPEYVSTFGLKEDWETNMNALEEFTKYGTSEFAIRFFIQQDTERVMSRMLAWADHENHHVRRFASEGCRPRLPWGIGLTSFKKDPSLIWPILEKLKADPEDYVRRSVANNANDIAKDHPDQVLDTFSRWQQNEHEHTNWIIKHGSRTLLKQAHPKALALFGYGDPEAIAVEALALTPETLAIGETLTFSFKLHTPEKAKLRIEYIIDYVKSNGKTGPKVFHVSEQSYDAGTHSFEREQSMRQMSTRKHYPGAHTLHVRINGVVKNSLEFTLTK